MSHSSAHDHASWLNGPSAQCELPEALAQPWRLVLLGAPGVGKGTQADLLTRELRACHLSTGDVFRAAAKNEGELSPAMKTATEHMRRGELVPDATVWEMICERIACLRCAGGFILDGFPRTLAQAESLTSLLEKEQLQLDAVVSYELPAAEVIARLSGRRTCKQCRTAFHVTDRPPQREGICDRCGGTLFQRDDDQPESIKVRLAAYDRLTAPLIEFYGKVGILLQVSASGTPEEICARTLTGLAEKRAISV
jgi:adenylate kinase